MWFALHADGSFTLHTMQRLRPTKVLNFKDQHSVEVDEFEVMMTLAEALCRSEGLPTLCLLAAMGSACRSSQPGPFRVPQPGEREPRDLGSATTRPW